jgi:hypothetical protein
MPRKGKRTMPEQPPANQSQPQAQQSGQPQAQQAPQAHQVEQHMVAAGLPPQALDTARAQGLNVQGVLQLVGRLLPVILQIAQEVGQLRQGGQGQAQPGGSQISQPSGQQTTEPTQP